jgi:hypothetical protein
MEMGKYIITAWKKPPRKFFMGGNMSNFKHMLKGIITIKIKATMQAMRPIT